MSQAVKDALFSLENAEMIENFGKKYSLAVPQPTNLAKEVGLVLLQFTRPADFAGILEKKLGIPREKAVAIAADVQREIFSKVPTMSTPTPVSVVPRLIAPLSVPVVSKPIAPVAAVPQKAQTAAVGTDEKNLRALFRISVGTNYTEDALREKFEELP